MKILFHHFHHHPYSCPENRLKRVRFFPMSRLFLTNEIESTELHFLLELASGACDAHERLFVCKMAKRFFQANIVIAINYISIFRIFKKKRMRAYDTDHQFWRDIFLSWTVAAIRHFWHNTVFLTTQTAWFQLWFGLLRGVIVEGNDEPFRSVGIVFEFLCFHGSQSFSFLFR